MKNVIRLHLCRMKIRKSILYANNQEKKKSIGTEKKAEIEMVSWLTIADFLKQKQARPIFVVSIQHSLPIEASYIGIFELKSNLFTILCSAASDPKFLLIAI